MSEDEVKKFQTGIQGYFTKKLAPNFKELDFYTGESMDPDGMYVPCLQIVLSRRMD